MSNVQIGSKTRVCIACIMHDNHPSQIDVKLVLKTTCSGLLTFYPFNVMF